MDSDLPLNLGKDTRLTSRTAWLGNIKLLINNTPIEDRKELIKELTKTEEVKSFTKNVSLKKTLCEEWPYLKI